MSQPNQPGSMSNPQRAPQTTGANPGSTKSMDEQAGGNNQAVERNPDGALRAAPQCNRAEPPPPKEDAPAVGTNHGRGGSLAHRTGVRCRRYCSRMVSNR
jgi:hypothetical protein